VTHQVPNKVTASVLVRLDLRTFSAMKTLPQAIQLDGAHVLELGRGLLVRMHAKRAEKSRKPDEPGARLLKPQNMQAGPVSASRGTTAIGSARWWRFRSDGMNSLERTRLGQRVTVSGP
jgi:hypothetical protein